MVKPRGETRPHAELGHFHAYGLMVLHLQLAPTSGVENLFSSVGLVVLDKINSWEHHHSATSFFANDGSGCLTA